MPKKKVAFITGCSTGLGFSTAQRLIESGYTVYATMQSMKNRDLLCKAVKNSKNLHVIPLDLAKDSDIIKAVETVLDREGRIDVIIHNASSVLIGPVDSASPDEVEYLFRVNVFSLIRINQLFLPQMRKQKSGHIIIISSISGVESSSYLGVYAATKFAQEALASSWATTLSKWNIKTTIIEPGAMNTNLPNTANIGTYYNFLDEDPYKDFNQNALAFLKECLGNGLNRTTCSSPA